MPTPPDLDRKLTEEESKQANEAAALNRAFSLLQNPHVIAHLQAADAKARFENDAALAQALQEEVPLANRPHPLLQNLTKKERADARAQLTPILNHPSVNSTPGVVVMQPDAHTYTRTFIRDNLAVLRAIDDQLRPGQATTILTPDQVLAELKQQYDEMPVATLANIEQTFSRLNLGIAQNHNSPVDLETLQNVPELLSRCWTLAKAYDPINSIARIASILSDNVGDAGGCLAGLVARLFAFQATTLSHILPAPYIPVAPAPRPNARPPVPVVRQAPQVTPTIAQATPQTTPVVVPAVARAVPRPRPPLTQEQRAQREANLALARQLSKRF